MTVWVVLLRGVNIGGRHIVDMKRLRELLHDAGFRDVQTYIQSGNCLFRSKIEDRERIAETVSSLIEREYGFRPAALALTADELDAALAANPFPSGEPKSIHLMFPCRPPTTIDVEGLRSVADAEEDFALVGNLIFLYLPHGAGRSPLAQKLGLFVKAEMTGRSIGSVRKIAEMARLLSQD